MTGNYKLTPAAVRLSLNCVRALSKVKQNPLEAGINGKSGVSACAVGWSERSSELDIFLHSDILLTNFLALALMCSMISAEKG